MARKPDLPEPTASELGILQVLWRRGPSSVRDVWNELGQKTGYTTILKLMQIMLEKKLVRRDERALSHIYEAAAPAKDTQEKLVSGLIDRAFDGSASQLVLRALGANSVSADELREIRQLIEQAEKKRR